METRISNEEKYSEAWKFYIEMARNIEQESDISHLGNYRISGDFVTYGKAQLEAIKKLIEICKKKSAND